MIAYTPEELIKIAECEFEWVDKELKRAAQDMGLGDDWKAALEKVKDDHVEPGEQPALIRDLALEATRYVQEHDLVTVPPLAADVWRVRMASPEAQKVAPYFLGGADIIVAFPTDGMSQEEKLQSLRSITATSRGPRCFTNCCRATTCNSIGASAATSIGNFSRRPSGSRAGRFGGSFTCGI